MGVSVQVDIISTGWAVDNRFGSNRIRTFGRPSVSL